MLKEADVKTLPKNVFGKVDTMGAPRLVEYWEQDPCGVEAEDDRRFPMSAPPEMAVADSAGARGNYGVKIEAKFTVGEYDIVIL